MEEIAKGDVLFVRSLGYDATVLEVLPRHDRVRVRAGNMEMEVPISDTGKKKGDGAYFKSERQIQDSKPRMRKSQLKSDS